MTTTHEPEILIIDAHGIYIPKLFCEGFKQYITNAEELKDEISDCEQGPDNEYYWDSWDTILNNAKLTNDKGESFTIGYTPEAGDLWAFPDGYEFPEDY